MVERLSIRYPRERTLSEVAWVAMKCTSICFDATSRQAGSIVHALALLGLALASPIRAQAPTTTRVSINSAGQLSNGQNEPPFISSSGRHVVYESFATNLDPGDIDSIVDIFLHDRATGVTELVSISSNGIKGNDRSGQPTVSFDGRYVAFSSGATNLVSGDTNGEWDIFLRDRLNGTTTRVSVDSFGAEGNGGSGNSDISLNGQVIVFNSIASNLVPGDANGNLDIFVHDITTGQTSLVSVDSNGNQANGYNAEPSISGDGRFVAFRSEADNLVMGDGPDSDIFLHDRVTGQTEIISLSSTGVHGNDYSNDPHVSGDGRIVAFGSRASNFVPEDPFMDFDIYARDRLTGQTHLVSVNSIGHKANGGGLWPSISSDGRYVAFGSDATNLVLHTLNGGFDCYVHDLETKQTWIASIDSGGNPGNSNSVRPDISAEARSVVFNSFGSNLVPGPPDFTKSHNYAHNRFGCPYPKVYCQASITSVPSCVLELSFAHAPLVGSPADFTIHSFAPGGVAGFLIVGASGPATVAMGTQGGLLCVQPPFWRTSAKPGRGIQGTCTGQFTFALSDLMAASPLVVAGNVLFTQLWVRDLASPDGFSLSDGVELTVCP